MTVGDRIVALRQDQDMSQEALARQVGITKSMLSKYENDINVPKADILGKIAVALEITSDYLLGLDTVVKPLVGKNQYRLRLSHEEYLLILKYRRLERENRIRIDERIETLLTLENEK